jgi:CDP-diacylglycerol--glycerol-3-phosphate 3-phosphatidyltransferase
VAADRDAWSEWSRRHDGYDVNRSWLVRGWLLLVHRLAAPLSRWHVPPNAVTAAGVAAAAAAAATARPLAALLVLLTAVCDGLDGAVAIQRGRNSRHGTLIDHSADRVTDVLFALALWRAGAIGWAASADAVAVLIYEVSRTVARRHGLTDGLVTAGERPIRVVVTVLGLVLAPTIGALAVAVLCAVALVQLRCTVRPWSCAHAGD